MMDADISNAFGLIFTSFFTGFLLGGLLVWLLFRQEFNRRAMAHARDALLKSSQKIKEKLNG